MFKDKKIIILVVILFTAVIITGGVLWYVASQQPVTNLTKVVNQPIVNEPININQPTGDEVVSGEIIPPTRTDCADELDTECWNTYRNTEYGFEFKYPGGWGAEKSTNNQRKIYINSDTLKENEWGIINEGLQLGVLISQNNSQDTDISIDKFDFGMQVGPLKETKDVVINSKTAKVFVFEGLNFLAFPENTDIILSSHLEYRDYKRIISININTGGKNRYLNYDLFRDIILPTFRFD